MTDTIGAVFMEGNRLSGYLVVDGEVISFGSVKHFDKEKWDLYPSKKVDESTREEEVILIPSKE